MLSVAVSEAIFITIFYSSNCSKCSAFFLIFLLSFMTFLPHTYTKIPEVGIFYHLIIRFKINFQLVSVIYALIHQCAKNPVCLCKAEWQMEIFKWFFSHIYKVLNMNPWLNGSTLSLPACVSVLLQWSVTFPQTGSSMDDGIASSSYQMEFLAIWYVFVAGMSSWVTQCRLTDGRLFFSIWISFWDIFNSFSVNFDWFFG